MPGFINNNKKESVLWGIFAFTLLISPLVFSSGQSISILSQIGIAIIACLSYNILLGQGGMLSFGHAVYSGLGAYAAIHALHTINITGVAFPVSLLPLVGGLAGMGFAAIFGYLTTKKSGTTFAMITMGMGELVFSMSLMVPEFFGGEGGVSANRVTGQAFLGINFAIPLQVYYLIAAYTLICSAAMYAFTHTPLGRMLNAVRDNPERVEFVGYDTRKVRYLSFIVAGFFAGIAGGLGAVNFEIVTAEAVGATRSGAYLFFTFLGGTSYFFGPIIGGVLLVLASALMSEFSKAWLLYLGLIFVFMVIYTPGGIASLVMQNVRVATYGKISRLWKHYFLLVVAILLIFVSGSSMIEMIYRLQLDSAPGSSLTYMGMDLDAKSTMSWLTALLVFALGWAAFKWVRTGFLTCWDQIQSEILTCIEQSMNNPKGVS